MRTHTISLWRSNKLFAGKTFLYIRRLKAILSKFWSFKHSPRINLKGEDTAVKPLTSAYQIWRWTHDISNWNKCHDCHELEMVELLFERYYFGSRSNSPPNCEQFVYHTDITKYSVQHTTQSYNRNKNRRKEW